MTTNLCRDEVIGYIEHEKIQTTNDGNESQSFVF